MNVLLSIKPEFAEKILSDEKQYEFRKTKFRDPSSINRVFMYASSPVQRIVGTFTLSNVIEDQPKNLWQRYESESGIQQKSRFLKYFSGVDTGYAIEIDEFRRLPKPVNPHQHIEDFRPPVSFQYMNGDYGFLLNDDPVQAASD